MGELVQPWHLLVILFCASLFLIPWIFYILTLSRTIEKCAPQSRALSSGLTWMLLIPLVNIIMHFIIVTGLAQTLANEFARRGIPSPEPRPGQSLGMAMCICAACSLIPIVGLLPGLAHLILWIIYWVKIAEFSRTLDLPQLSAAYYPPPQQ